MVDQLRSFADEVTRVAREVGTEGQLGGQAEVRDVSGVWRDLTENVNFMASNLTSQVRNIAQVATAVAKGDLTQKITVDAKGEVAALADTINSMTDTLGVFAEQVTGVAREVGTDGKLGGQAEVPGVAGTWKDLTESVNSMAANLTDQVRNIAAVTTAVAQGDLSQKITVDAKGEVNQLKETINTMVDQLGSFADEVTRVAREVGTEGRLGGQAFVPGVAGTWKDLTDNVNFMANNLTDQVRNIAQVTTAVAKGDLSQKITVDVKGEVLALKNTINTMVDQLRSFADEVTRVAREVGTEGKLGGQAEVKEVSGTWRDLTENVNQMARNLTDQVRNVAQVTTAVANGDLSKKITVDARGEILELKDTINTMVDQLSSFAAEVTRVAREVGTEGKLGGQAEVAGVSGTWKGLTENVNGMAVNLTDQVRGIATVTTAVANGDLSKKITVEAKGEVATLADTINTMVDQLRSFAAEVTRVAREVGTEGQLGGQARVEGVSGTWRDLTDNVNFMAANLTSQVRNIAQVATAVANGDLGQKITVDAQGEILELKQTINVMVDQLSSFADEVTRVAREVGTEGKLGGQARVEGVEGTWRDLTENVNQLAGNLTTQVRAIAEVSTAVTQGDLTRSITVQAEGEVAELKDNINQMIENLRETTKVNAEQDWLKTNLARISGMLQGQRDIEAVTQLIMSEVTPVVSAQHGALFLVEHGDSLGEAELRVVASYGYKPKKGRPDRFALGDGLVGQAAVEGKTIRLTDVPSDYIKISSALGDATPAHLVVMPVMFEEQVLGVIELGRAAALQRGQPGLPGPARGHHRRGHQHDPGQHAHRAAADPVAGADPGAPEAVARAAPDQRRAAGQDARPAAAEPRHRDQERRDRARPRGPRGEGGPARPELEVQVGVPGQHEPRAAHAAELAADPLADAGRERRRQPAPPADRVRRDHPRGRQRPARADQRHPRPVQGRGRQDGAQPRAAGPGRPLRGRRARLPAGGRAELARVPHRARPRAARRPRHRRAAPAAGAAQPALQRVQVHPARARSTLHIAPGRGRDDRLLGHRHRRRHPRGQALADLRALPAGRRHDVAQVRRHRPGPVDLARDRPPAGRRAARAVDAGRGLDLHARRSRWAPRRPPTPATEPVEPAALPALAAPTSSRPPRCCPSTAPTTIAPRSSRAIACCSIIAHDAELAARRARRGARAELPLPRRPPRRRSAWRWPASTAPRRCSSSPPTAAARSCSASSSSIPRPAIARSSWPARPAGGCRPCAPAPPATWRAPAGPRPSPTWSQALDDFNARSGASPGAHRGRAPSSTPRR